MRCGRVCVGQHLIVFAPWKGWGPHSPIEQRNFCLRLYAAKVLSDDYATARTHFRLALLGAYAFGGLLSACATMEAESHANHYSIDSSRRLEVLRASLKNKRGVVKEQH